MSSSRQYYERDVDGSRSNFGRTADTHGRKMSVSQLVDEAARYIGGREVVSHLGEQVRANPIPLALVGVGLAWMFSGRGPRLWSSQRDERGYGYDYDTEFSDFDYDEEYRRSDRYAGTMRRDVWNDASGGQTAWSEGNGNGNGRSWTGAASDALDSAGSAARSAVHGVSEAVSSAASGAASTAASVGHGMYSAADSVAEGARYAARRARRTGIRAYDQASHIGSRARGTFSELLDEEPLVLGALGLAVGAAVGAALPPTRAENRYFGRYRDQLADEAQHYVREQYERGKAVAAEAVRSAKEEAEAQGLSPEGMREAAERAREAARDIAEAAVEGARSAAAEPGTNPGTNPGTYPNRTVGNR
jgi:hypothetical protein